jgi:hypothetical protein
VACGYSHPSSEEEVDAEKRQELQEQWEEKHDESREIAFQENNDCIANDTQRLSEELTSRGAS